MVVVFLSSVYLTGMLIDIMGNEERERRGGTQKNSKTLAMAIHG